MVRRAFAVALLPALGLATYAAVAGTDFSGKWILDARASSTRSIERFEPSLDVSQGAAGILCTADGVQWSYALDGSETRKRVGDETRNSVVKWEGEARLVNTLISAAQDYSVMDRWTLSGDGNTLRIVRQVVRGGVESEGTLVYRREGTMPEPRTVPEARSTADPPPSGRDVSPMTLSKRPEPGIAPDITVPKGSRVLLSLVGEVSTKRAKDGDHVYLRTAAPVSADGRVVIPTGSDVGGTITHTKPAGKVRGKGELFIRFDSLTLPNGVSRDFHARPSGDEGSVDGNRKNADAGTVIMTTGMGASIGAITRGLGGAAVGGGIGALAGVLLSRQQDVVLRPGTHLEMVLDRDLVFHPEELRRDRQ
jgi:type IV secretion system protein VirB10